LDFDRKRTRSAREAAERALVRLALALGERHKELIVIGGLTPDLLTREPPAAHQGTTDVDVLLQVGFIYDRDELEFSWLQQALDDAGFNLVGPSGWRWWVDIDGIPVKLEVLCDTPDNVWQQIALPGCDRLTAMNLSGPRPALTSFMERDLPVHRGDAQATGEERVSVTLRFADLGGYMLAKAAAAFVRKEPKDFYDFAFVLLYNDAGGPAAAAEAIVEAAVNAGPSQSLSQLKAVAQRFTDPTGDAARIFALEMAAGGAIDDIAVLAQDAAGGALALLEALSRPDTS
jgi:hypothetical protein